MKRAKFGVENYGKEYQVNLLTEKNEKFYFTLNDEEKLWVEKTLTILDKEYTSSDELQTEIYGAVNI